MAFEGREPEDQYEALTARRCRNCGHPSRNLEDGWCPRCNGDDDEAQVREANRAAWDKFYSQHPGRRR